MEDHLEETVFTEISKEGKLDYLKRRLMAIDKVQADMFIPDRIKGECGLCGRECFGLFGVEPDTCSYCARETSTIRGNSEERSSNIAHAIRWAELMKAQWEPREGQGKIKLDGSSFTNQVIKIIPGKMAEHRNKAWG